MVNKIRRLAFKNVVIEKCSSTASCIGSFRGRKRNNRSSISHQGFNGPTRKKIPVSENRQKIVKIKNKYRKKKKIKNIE